MQYDEVMCVACTSDKYILKSKCINGKVLLALNVGQDQTSKSVFIADRVRQGNHWTLLAVEVKEKLAYYGDSLRWDAPSNLIHMVEQLLSSIGNWRASEASETLFTHVYGISRYIYIYMHTSVSNTHARMTYVCL